MEGENSKPSDDLGSQKYHLLWSPSLIYFTTKARPKRLELWVWVGAQWPPGEVKYFPISAWQQQLSSHPGSASFEQSESAWSHCVGQDRSQAWHSSGSWLVVRFPGVNQQLSAHDEVGEVFRYLSALLCPAAPPPWWLLSRDLRVCCQACCLLLELKSSGFRTYQD